MKEGFRVFSKQESEASERVRSVERHIEAFLSAALCGPLDGFREDIKSLDAQASFRFSVGVVPQLVIVIDEGFLDREHENVTYTGRPVAEANGERMEELIEKWFGSRMRRMDISFAKLRPRKFASVTRYDISQIGGKAQECVTGLMLQNLDIFVREWIETCDERIKVENAVQAEERNKFPRKHNLSDQDDREMV